MGGGTNDVVVVALVVGSIQLEDDEIGDLISD